MQTPRTEFAQALKAVATERGLDADVILETIKQAIIAAYKRDAREKGEDTEVNEYDVELDSTSGEAKVFSWPLEKPEERKDVTPPGFGRIAAQTAKQVIHQKIREAEKGALMDEYSARVGALISGMILRFDGPDVRVDLGRTEGIMPASERVPNERLNPNQRLTYILKAIIDTPKGKTLILSRADENFVKKLFEREVPEVGSKSVEIKAIAREAGVRTKIAVSSNQSGVDPVGSCVGQKGVRVQAVTNELGGERIDIIPYTENTSDFIKNALSPAENLVVVLDEKLKMAIVKAPTDQLSLAIGRDGQNARLAGKLTGWKIEIKENEEKVESLAEDKIVKKVKKSDKAKVEEKVEAAVEKESEKKTEVKEEKPVDKKEEVIATQEVVETQETSEKKPEAAKTEEIKKEEVATLEKEVVKDDSLVAQEKPE